MKSYRFVFDTSQTARANGRRQKQVCPRCGHRSLVLYIDRETGKPLGENCGKCDHEQSCGYNLTPKQYARDNHLNLQGGALKPSPMETAPLQPLRVPNYYVREAERHAWDSPLVAWLSNIFNRETVAKAVSLYHVGQIGRYTVFPQIGVDGWTRTGKMIAYRPDGHRDREAGADWLHSYLRRYGHGKEVEGELHQCLFGLRLLRDRSASTLVRVFEGEKSALAMTCYDIATGAGNVVNLATGGCAMLKNLLTASATILQGFDSITLFPDAGEAERWKRDVADSGLVELLKVSVNTELERYDWNTDIADVLAAEAVLRPTDAQNTPDGQLPSKSRENASEGRKTAKEAILERANSLLAEMRSKNPAIAILEKGLQLEAVKSWTN